MEKRISETDRIVARFTRKTDIMMERIGGYIGCELHLTEMGKPLTWILHSCNDIGVLYWHKKGRKKLYTIAGYRHTDLPKLFPDFLDCEL